MMFKKIFPVVFLLLSSINLLFSQQAQNEKIAILHFKFSSLDSADVSTIESILRLEISKTNDKDIVSLKRLEAIHESGDCFGIQCAVQSGKAVNADEALALQLSKLGEKIITHFMLLDVDKGSIIIEDRISSSDIEDLEDVMKRIAVSVANHQSIKNVAEVGNIMENETKSFKKRGTVTNFGLIFGYLHPQNGYDNEKRSFTGNIRIELEMEDYAFGFKLGGRQGLFMNLYGEYLITRKDLCPFVGASFGFHRVSHNEYSYYHYDSSGNYITNSDDKKEDGFELTFNTGIRIFRTYNFQLIANLGYSITFNDYDDRAVIFTIGVLL